MCKHVEDDSLAGDVLALRELRLIRKALEKMLELQVQRMNEQREEQMEKIHA